jgi:L-2-hydroxycarboxylate dehydrogenase (NAD+)
MYSADKIRKFTEKVFKSIGCSTKDAKLAADVLVNADLNGVDSHGVARLAGYVRLYDHGRLNPTPTIKIVLLMP